MKSGCGSRWKMPPSTAPVLKLPVPMLDVKAFLKMLQLDLIRPHAGGAGAESPSAGRAGEAAAHAARAVCAIVARAGETGIDCGEAAASGGRRAGGDAGAAKYASSGQLCHAWIRAERRVVAAVAELLGNESPGCVCAVSSAALCAGDCGESSAGADRIAIGERTGGDGERPLANVGRVVARGG